MPKLTSVDSAIEKSRRYIRKVLQGKETSLKFTNFQSKSCIIYKLNKFHYYDTELHVIDHQTIKYLSTQAKLPNFIELIHLDLCNIKDDGLIQFMKGQWNNVRFLALGSNGITLRGIEALIKGKNLIILKQLSLNDNFLDANAGSVLAKGSWKKLELINLNFNTLGDLGLKNLQTHPWRLLKELHLLKNNIGNEGAIALVSMINPQLQKLFLSHNYITDDGCKILAKGQWKHLKTLQLDGNYLKDDSLKYLILLGSYNFDRLTLFASKTCVINTSQRQTTMPTMAGLALLSKGCWSQLKLQVFLNKLGQMSKQNLITVPVVKQMLKIGNTNIILTPR